MSCAVWTQEHVVLYHRAGWSLDDAFAADEPAVSSLPLSRFTAAHWLQDWEGRPAEGTAAVMLFEDDGPASSRAFAPPGASMARSSSGGSIEVGGLWGSTG